MSLHLSPLHHLHTELGARMVDFAGWSLPIHYDGILAETDRVRRGAGLFDVSHMGVLDLRGPTIAADLEALTPASLTTMVPGQMRYALLTNDGGGVLDDVMVIRPAERIGSAQAEPSDADPTVRRASQGDTNPTSASHLTLVVNAARRDHDRQYLHGVLTESAANSVEERHNYALLALQGPAAHTALEAHVPGIGDVVFMQHYHGAFRLDSGHHVPIEITRSGYTGEDGFELLLAADSAAAVAHALLAHDAVGPAGLGARDALRLEAGLCLYGQDLNETITPIEAGLGWAIPPRRRREGGYRGANVLTAQFAQGVARQRVGLRVEGKRPVREGASLHQESLDAPAIGEVTSGGYSPTLSAPIAMGFLPPATAAIGTPIIANVRGHAVTCVVAELPFVPHRYVRGR